MRQLKLTALSSACKLICHHVLVPALSLILFSTACRKHDIAADNEAEKIRTALLTTGEWKLDTWTWIVNPAGTVAPYEDNESSTSVPMETCQKDDVTIFKANGDVVMDPKTLCDDDPTPVLTTSRWKFTNDRAGIIIGTGADATTYTIVEFTANRLKVRNTNTDAGTAYISEIVMVH
ncbi:lipocalin-like domain-containing protein [Niabella drilacis]|uniref:Lipocalin-like domain-containing protein n=1 Tax=Niabella drilacis (strain DSM 25811 / CCM 8410 / CCUG 62505 / LMG 26954 / E90) TaxID=1285928 RepID=A0A1G6LS35_NIADE|nr:lipocalin family protein [Niabella drilacis]SDC46050.1 Lipocalin-like domain-containing protein [Niabella drilacis]